MSTSSWLSSPHWRAINVQEEACCRVCCWFDSYLSIMMNRTTTQCLWWIPAVWLWHLLCFLFSPSESHQLRAPSWFPPPGSAHLLRDLLQVSFHGWRASVVIRWRSEEWKVNAALLSKSFMKDLSKRCYILGSYCVCIGWRSPIYTQLVIRTDGTR